MEETELRQIVNEVISALQTNSKTIDQLTAIETLGENDFFEVNGGRKVSYVLLSKIIVALSKDNILQSILDRDLKTFSTEVSGDNLTLYISTTTKKVSTIIPLATISSAGLLSADDYKQLSKLKDTVSGLSANIAAVTGNVKTVAGKTELLEERVTALEEDNWVIL